MAAIRWASSVASSVTSVSGSLGAVRRGSRLPLDAIIRRGSGLPETEAVAVEGGRGSGQPGAAAKEEAQSPPPPADTGEAKTSQEGTKTRKKKKKKKQSKRAAEPTSGE